MISLLCGILKNTKQNEITKPTEKESRLGSGWGNWRKGVKRYKLVGTRRIRTRDVMWRDDCSRMICGKVVQRENPKNSHHEEKFVFLFSFLLSLLFVASVQEAGC